MDFILSLTVVLPICIYIVIGVLVKRLNWISTEGIKGANALIYKLFFPFVMFSNIYASNLDETLNGKLITFMLILSTIVFIFLCLLIPIFIKERPVQGSMIQGIYRGNSILFAIPIVSSIYGNEKAGIAAVCVSIIVPFFNVLCVILLENRRGSKANLWRVSMSVFKNPIILGALLGLFVKVMGLHFPEVIEHIIEDMAGVVTPFALILLGAGLSFGDIQKNKWKLIVVCVLKLMIIPLFIVSIAYGFGYRDVELITIFALFSVPTAVSTYVMAQEMDADGELAGEIVAFTSIASIITIFLWVLLLTGIGLIQV